MGVGMGFAIAAAFLHPTKKARGACCLWSTRIHECKFVFYLLLWCRRARCCNVPPPLRAGGCDRGRLRVWVQRHGGGDHVSLQAPDHHHRDQ